MKWIEIKVVFESEEPAVAEDLVSSLFYDFNLQGVVVEQPDMQPEEGWADDAVDQPSQSSIIGYLPDNELLEIRCGQLETKLALLEDLGIKTTTSRTEVDEEDWAESWKEFFKPVRITRRVVVKPTWHEYDPVPGDMIIEIDPGMAFGTGTHPTTSLCIRMIEKYMRSGDTFLDVGTGSGILSIAAAMYGAKNITGVDIDEVAVEIAEKNLKLNNVKQAFLFKTGTVTEVEGELFDFAVANMTSEIIVSCLDEINATLKDGASIVLSGIISKNIGEVTAKLDEIGITVVDMALEDDWAAIVGCKVGSGDDIFNW